jgi:hypothetical protein
MAATGRGRRVPTDSIVRRGKARFRRHIFRFGAQKKDARRFKVRLLRKRVGQAIKMSP